MRKARTVHKPDTTRNPDGLDEAIEHHRRKEAARPFLVVRENRNTIRVVRVI